jgi:hypothetical protein
MLPFARHDLKLNSRIVPSFCPLPWAGILIWWLRTRTLYENFTDTKFLVRKGSRGLRAAKAARKLQQFD